MKTTLRALIFTSIFVLSAFMTSTYAEIVRGESATSIGANDPWDILDVIEKNLAIDPLETSTVEVDIESFDPHLEVPDDAVVTKMAIDELTTGEDPETEKIIQSVFNG